MCTPVDTLGKSPCIFMNNTVYKYPTLHVIRHTSTPLCTERLELFLQSTINYLSPQGYSRETQLNPPYTSLQYNTKNVYTHFHSPNKGE
jgi:hypothetical protein